MAAYFCSKCRTNWPVRDAYKSCPDCDQFTFHSTTAEPEVQESVVEHAAIGTQITDPHLWRVERYLELGFTEADSQLLACAKTQATVDGKVWTNPLHWLAVEKALNGGCTHELAVAIFS